MSWAVGYDSSWHRDIGYGVPAMCDQPGCGESIDRGLDYVCGNEPYGGEYGCGLYFCDDHIGTTWGYRDVIEDGEVVDEIDVQVACTQHDGLEPTPDVAEWTEHKLTDPSWQQWRDDNPAEVAALTAVPLPKDES